MKKFSIFLGILLVLMVIGTRTIEADGMTRYDTFTTSNNRLVRTQTAYIPITKVDNIYGESLGVPNDIHIDLDNTIYIVSTEGGSGKLLRFNLTEESVDVLGEDYLVNPTGVHVNRNGDILVADRGSRAAYRLNQEGDILQTFERPDSPLFGADTFQPRKIVGDTRGNVYVLNQGQRGLAQFSPNGDFLGYYGPNTIVPTWRTIIQHTFFTEEQQSRLFNLVPPEVTNVSIDQRGLIHTVSRGIENHGIKRLNISGENLLPSMVNHTNLVDITVGPLGNIYAISDSGMITEYDREGNLLFMFGGQDVSNQIKGLFNVPSAIGVDSDYNLYTLDRASGEMQIFMPTEFASLVHTALESYQEGFYEVSQGPWNEVLKMNDFFDLAHQGLANAHYSLGEYEEALEAYETAYDRSGYSDAFWEVRNDWLLANVGSIIWVFFTVLVFYIINLKAKFMRKITDPMKAQIKKFRGKYQTVDELLFAFTYLKNPADATYDIKRKNRVSVFSATILLIIYFLVYIYYIYNLSFLFNHRIISSINLVEELLVIFLPFTLWVVANYLVGSIREGEGRLKDIYITTIFAVLPFFMALPVLTFFSQALTYNEAFMMDFIQIIAVMLSAIYFFFMVKETHYYSVKDTFKSILISIFTMVMMLLGVIIVYMLLNELVVVIRDIIMEVIHRV